MPNSSTQVSASTSEHSSQMFPTKIVLSKNKWHIINPFVNTGYAIAASVTPQIVYTAQHLTSWFILVHLFAKNKCHTQEQTCSTSASLVRHYGKSLEFTQSALLRLLLRKRCCLSWHLLHFNNFFTSSFLVTPSTSQSSSLRHVLDCSSENNRCPSHRTSINANRFYTNSLAPCRLRKRCSKFDSFAI